MGLLDSILGAFASNGTLGGTPPEMQPGDLNEGLRVKDLHRIAGGVI